MKTVVVYVSKHGCTEKCAKLLVEKLQGNVTSVNLEKEKVPDLQEFDTVVIGGSIHVGKVQKSVTAFIAGNMDTLLQKKVGLFLCCSNVEAVDAQMKGAFPEPLYSHASAREHLGFAYYFNKMNFMERKIINMVAKEKESKENILMENLDRFIMSLH
jgi:menaquinone-dependent protoporphyrinogen oxidase